MFSLIIINVLMYFLLFVRPMEGSKTSAVSPLGHLGVKYIVLGEFTMMSQPSRLILVDWLKVITSRPWLPV